MNCKRCSAGFVVSDWEKQFLERLRVPAPTLCPDCRHQRRLAHRNERSLYRTTCAKTGKPIISMYAPEKNLTVYSPEAWWSDAWDPRDYGRDFDFSRPFFEQFAELQKIVPRIALFNIKSENSDYCNITEMSKNCYLCIGSEKNEDSYYSTYDFNSKSSCDNYWINEAELCYQCVDCVRCFNVRYAQYSQSCNDSAFLYDCRNCEKCIGCVGLRGQKYRIFNQSCSPEEYDQKMQELKSWNGVEKMKEEFRKFRLQFPHRANYIVNSEECTGSNIVEGKHCVNCFDIDGPAQDVQDSIITGLNSKDILSCDHAGLSEMIYENMSSVYSNTCGLSIHTRFGNEVWYSEVTANGTHLLGCSHMKRAQYCILNKQYSKEDYFTLKDKIIGHMQRTGEWGQFFPVQYSLFGYNESMAQEFLPLTREQALAQGFNWFDYEHKLSDINKVIPAEKLPETIDKIPDDVLNWAIRCEATGRLFKIIAQELTFYRKQNIPLPHHHPEERHRRRLLLRNPRKLWKRTCAKCQASVDSVYAPERPEIVYCEACYLKEVY